MENGMENDTGWNVRERTVGEGGVQMGTADVRERTVNRSGCEVSERQLGGRINILGVEEIARFRFPTSAIADVENNTPKSVGWYKTR